jgi:hypothetical protein
MYLSILIDMYILGMTTIKRNNLKPKATLRPGDIVQGIFQCHRQLFKITEVNPDAPLLSRLKGLYLGSISDDGKVVAELDESRAQQFTLWWATECEYSDYANFLQYNKKKAGWNPVYLATARFEGGSVGPTFLQCLQVNFTIHVYM